MVKKKTKKTNLNHIRNQIDEVDNSILKLLSKRSNLVVEAGEIKENIGDTSYYKPEREAKIINTLISKNKSRLNQNHIKNIYREIISACFSLEKKIEVLIKKIIEIDILDKDGIIIIHRKKGDLDNYPKKFKVIDTKSYGLSTFVFGKKSN